MGKVVVSENGQKAYVNNTGVYQRLSDLEAQMAGAKDSSVIDGINNQIAVNTASLAESAPQPVIWDTDWWTDVDDVVAARILCWAERQGMIDIVCVGMSATFQYSVSSLDAFFISEGRRGMTIGIDSAATDFGGTPLYQQNMASNNPHDIQSNSDAEDVVRMYRRALATAKSPIDFILTGYPQGFANLLQSTADDISSLTGMQLVTNNVRKVWMMAGQYPSGSENNFTRNARSQTAGNYICANCPVPITFLGWEVGNSVLSGGTLASVSPAAIDVVTKALSDFGATSGRSSWDPMTVLMACYGDPKTAGFTTIKGTNSVDASTGANTFTIDPNGKHEYVVKLYSDTWYQNQLNNILEKKAWKTRKLGTKQLPRVVNPTTSPLIITNSLANGSYVGTQTAILTPNKGCLMFYTLDGTTPTTSSTRYTGSIAVPDTVTTLKYFGLDLDGNFSPVQTNTYSISFDPNAGLVGLYKANAIASTDGTTISTWNDSSPAGNNLTSSGTLMPTYKAAKAGKPAVSFNGANQMLTTATPSFNGYATVYMKVLFDTAPSSNQTIVSQDAGNIPASRFFHETVISGGTFEAIGFNNGNNGNVSTQTGSLSTGVWHTFVGVYTPNTVQAYFDGVANTPLTTAGALNTGSTKLALGGTFNGSGTWAEQLNGSIAEIRVYNSAHSSSDVASVISLME